ncbi:MAG: uroporphyrinogen-III synthase [Bacteroidales bacterium]|nr:uroporphyrinogen-III synthase [Bacteroidales bacterium]
MKLKKILISQPEPADLEKSPYRRLVDNFKLDLTFYKFFEVVGITATEFRKSRIHLTEYTAVIFNSKNSVDHFFRMSKELREPIPESMKYFCSTEAIALYLQNYIQYRKRKIFFGNQYFADLIDVMSKHREEKFLFPCSDEKQTEYTKLLDKAKFKYTKAAMYRSIPRDLKQFKLEDFDMIALFSPIGVRSLLMNFPDAKNSNIMVAAFGTSTHAALNAAGIKITIAAPTKISPSMAMAIENYLLGKQQEAVLVVKPSVIKASKAIHAPKSATPKKNKSVFVSKTKYKQLMEEKKAKAAARRAERAAERARAAEEEAAKAAKKSAAAKSSAEKPSTTKAPAKTSTATKTAAPKTAAKKSTATKSTTAKPSTTKSTATKSTTTKTSAAKSTTAKSKKS